MRRSEESERFEEEDLISFWMTPRPVTGNSAPYQPAATSGENPQQLSTESARSREYPDPNVPDRTTKPLTRPLAPPLESPFDAVKVRLRLHWGYWLLLAALAILLVAGASVLFRVKVLGRVGTPAAAEARKFTPTGERASDPLARSISDALEHNLITSSRNPLLTPSERSALLRKTLEGLPPGPMRQQILDQHEAMEKQMQESKLSKESWYEHVAACEQVCSPAFHALVSRHFARVAESPHTLVFFGVGKSDLVAQEQDSVRRVAAELASANKAGSRVLLVGRGSRTGSHDFNMSLSERRVRAVQEALAASGVAPERMESFWLGWEQPYLTDEIASNLQIPTSAFQSDEKKLNQSVMLVLYSPSSPGLRAQK